MILLLPFVAFGVGALGALVLRGQRAAANNIGAAFALVGAALVTIIAGLGFTGHAPTVAYEWRVPMGALLLTADPLSAWFLVPVAGLGALAAVYGHGYWRDQDRDLGVAWAAFNLVLAGMTGVLLARNGILFLMSWEVMSLAAWALVSLEHERAEARSAGWVYLVATHVGVSALLVLFLLLRGHDGGAADFTHPLDRSAPVTVLVALALLGFGAKAGLVPLHVWLPEAHAAAPSHVSALMSGVLVKMGIYGLLRMLLVIGKAPDWLPSTLMGLGLLGGFIGIASALGQRDLKRTLAYSTVENVGIIVLGLGVGLWGRAHDAPVVAGFGLAGALLHVWNHAAMKGLLFFGAGSVLHGAGTKDVEQLGGLMRRMPWTGLAMTVGATAIAGLPPLAGFTGEWAIFLGLIEGGRGAQGSGGVGLFLAVGAFSVVGTLAAAAFTRLVGVVLLGEPRSAAAGHAHDAPPTMRAAMATLGVMVVGLGLASPLVVRAAGGAIRALAPTASLPDLTPLTYTSAALWAGIATVALVLRSLLRGRPAPRTETWGCGYTAPSTRMQYTGRSYAVTVESALVPEIVRPHAQEPAVQGVLARPARFTATYADPLLERLFFPFFRKQAVRLARVRRLQQGNTWLYVGYIAGILVVGFAWSLVRGG